MREAANSSLRRRSAESCAMSPPQPRSPFAEMREMGIRGLLIFCPDYKCSHSIAISGDRWPDHVRLSELEPLFRCQVCGLKGAEVRGDFNWEREQNKPAGVNR